MEWWILSYWWLLIPAGFLGIAFGLYPPVGLMLLFFLVFFVPALMIMDPLGLGALFYIAFALAIGYPCLTMLWLSFTEYEREAEREAATWKRKHDGGMLP